MGLRRSQWDSRKEVRDLRAKIIIDEHRRLGKIDPNIYGQYLEHVDTADNCIYNGVFHADSHLSDEVGLRRDVIDCVKDMAAPIVRWPGGCFADIYRWEDGIGPQASRPVRRNWYWSGIECNQFGTDEFLSWCKKTGAVPYINVNMGTGTLDEAIRWLDYCNGTEPTTEAMKRAANGHSEPYGVKYWGLGNETWGEWEPGHSDAQTYANRLREWAQFFRKVDKKVKLLGVGSAQANDPDWDTTVLKTAGHLIDYLTIHIYAHTTHLFEPEDYYPTVTNSVYFEKQLQRMAQVVQVVSEQMGYSHRIKLSLDEWNIRHLDRREDGSTFLRRRSSRTLKDALFAAGVFHGMHRLCEDVGMACYVFLVNGNGVIEADDQGVVKTPLYHVFKAYRELMQGIALDVVRVESPSFLTPVRQGHLEAINREVDYLDVSAALTEDGESMTVALINRHRDATIDVELTLPGWAKPTTSRILYDDDVLATNDKSQPNRVRFVKESIPDWNSMIECPPHSIVILSCGRHS
jgi:alpha-N-arabinofuranosidase